MNPQRLFRRKARASSAPRRSAVARLRLAFFAQAGEVANRYHVRFERVLEHLWQSRRTNRRLLLRSVGCVDDLVHAIACVDEVGLAWADLSERYERALIRRCRCSQDEIEATIFVRQLFADLRKRNREDCVAHHPSLRCYAGTRPLRSWLADRLSAARTRKVWMTAPQSLSQCGSIIIAPGIDSPSGPLVHVRSAPAFPALRLVRCNFNPAERSEISVG